MKINLNLLQFLIGKLLNLVPRNNIYSDFFFNSLARLTVSIAIEGVLIKKNTNNKIEIFLTKRGKKQAYANLWHIPGSIMRTQESQKDAINRIAKEINVEITTFHRLSEHIDESIRGTILQQIYIINVVQTPQETSEKKWFNINNLPNNIVENHRDVIIPMLKTLNALP